jgi:hypothetical protein
MGEDEYLRNEEVNELIDKVKKAKNANDAEAAM